MNTNQITTPEKELPPVIITHAFLGIVYMAVCVRLDVTDEQVLQHCNANNPSGTQYGWTRVIRDSTSELPPVSCADYPDERLHLVVAC